MSTASTCAIWYKLWLETRMRFVIALALNLAVSLFYVVMQRHYYGLDLKMHPGASYAQYISSYVFTYLPRVMYQFTGFVIGSSGWQQERRRGSLGFSLALPRGRTQQIFDRALFEAAQMVAIPFVSLLSVWALSNVLGHALPLTTALLFVVLWTVGGLFVYALTFLCSVVAPGGYTAIAAAYILYSGYMLVTHLPRWLPYPLNSSDLMRGRLGNVLDLHTGLWTGNVPVAILCGHLAAASLLVEIAIVIVSLQEI